jgi:hypothetical protein
MLDFPRVVVKSFEVRPIPEALDDFSIDAFRSAVRSINLTPAIAEVTERLGAYLVELESRVGMEVETKSLMPPYDRLEAFGVVYKVHDAPLYLGFGQDKDTADAICHLQILGTGPNLGSAGGPTLQVYGNLATLGYEGRLEGPCRDYAPA